MKHTKTGRKQAAVLLLVIVSVLGVGSVLAAPGSWSSSGPFGAASARITVDPANPDTIYAIAALAGVYKTTDAGLTWTKSDTGLATAPVELVVDPNDSTRLFAVAAGSVFRSNDGGGNWFLANAGITGDIVDIAISTTLPTVVYATGTSGAFRSTSLGTTWTAINSGLSAATDTTFPIEVDPLDGDRVLVVQRDTAGTTVYETTNGGASWSALSGSWGPFEFIQDISFGPGDATYIGGEQLHSRLGAGSWVAGVAIGFLDSIAPHPSDVGRVLGMVRSIGVFETTNRGASWTELGAGISANGFDVAGVNDGAYRPGTPSTIYLMAVGAGFHRSIDSGTTWTARNVGLRANNMRAVAVHPTDSNYIYAGASSGSQPLAGIYRSIDGGLNWSQSNTGLDLLGVRDIAIDPNTSASTATTHLYAMGFGRFSLDGVAPHEVGLFKSTDGGSSWMPSRNGIPDSPAVRLSSPLRRLVMDPTSGLAGTGPLQTLYVAGSGNPNQGSARVYKSTDAGANWSASETGLPTPTATELQIAIDLVIDPVTPTTLYVGTLLSDFGATPSTTANGVFKSIDGGLSWTHSSVGLPQKDSSVIGGAQQDILALGIDPVTPSTLYAGVANFTNGGSLVAQVYKSTDSGANWALSNTGIAPGSDIRAIEVDPGNPATVYVALSQSGGSPGGVYQSNDFGVTWSSISVGLPASSATSLAVDSSGINPVLYAGTGSGVFEIEQLPDLDLDGASSAEEMAAPNTGDGNNDGTPDASQTAVASIGLAATGPLSRVNPAGQGEPPYLTIAIASGSCDSIVNAQVLAVDEYPQERAYVLPFGMVSFELPDCAAATIDLIYSGVDLSMSDRIRSFGPTTPGDSSTLSSYDFEMASRLSARWTLMLEDGELGDVRPADGTILFRGGPALFLNQLVSDGFE